MTMVVTPWEVRGEIDYDRLIREFGTKRITPELLERIKKHTGDLHFLLRRGIFFSHRDLDWILDEYERGNRFYLYTGRGPSENVHIGHLVPWVLTKWLQDRFGAKLYFQMTDDEKYLFKRNLELEEANRLAYENALDVIALGFDPDKTFIFSDIDYAKTLYREAIKVAKRLTLSTAKAVFGFKNSNNVGEIFFTSMQAVPAFLESVKTGRNVPCLIPYAIDQDAHFRVARDILPKLGFYKPAAIHSKFVPGLLRGGKMSASDPRSAIFTVDDPETVRKKISAAFTGGRDTAEEQKKLGGRPEICSVFRYFEFFFEEDDRKLQEIFSECKSGSRVCGDCKEQLAKKVIGFLENHQKKRERARDVLERFIVRD